MHEIDTDDTLATHMPIGRAGLEIFQIFQDWNISVEIFDFETFLNISNISGNI